MTEKHLLTHSRMASFRACPRRHFHRYVEGYRRISEAFPLRFGSAVHQGIQVYWLARGGWWGKVWEICSFGRNDPCPSPWVAATEAPEIQALDPFDRCKAETMLAGYTTQWDGIEVKQILGVEEKLMSPLLNPGSGKRSSYWERAGKLDLRVLLANGQAAIVEHKTTSEDTSIGSAYRERLQMDGQISHYLDMTRANQLEGDVVIYDVLVKPRMEPALATPIEKRKYTQPKSKACPSCKKKGSPPPPHVDPETNVSCVDGRVITDPGGQLYATMRESDETTSEYQERIADAMAEKPSEYFQRIEVPRLERDQAVYEWNVWHWSEAMRNSAESGIAPQNPDACFRYGSPCEFWGVCTGTESLEDFNIFKKLSDVHPELEREDENEAA